MDDRNPYRSPEPPSPDDEPAESGAADDRTPFTGRLTTVATYFEPIQADLARARLEGEGIRAFIEGATFASMDWHLSLANRGVKVQVPTEDAERASALLRNPSRAAHVEHGGDESTDFDNGDAEEDDDQETEDEWELTVRDESAERAFRGAVFGLLFFPIQFYVFWLLLKVFVSDEPLSPRSRRRALVAAAINLPLIVIIGFWLKSFFPRH
jgi:hypothetical protein